MAFPKLIPRPSLPKPSGNIDNRSLSAYDSDLLNSLDKALGEISRAFNQTRPASAISTRPIYEGQIAVVAGVPYIATGTASSADWKEITVV